MDFPKKVPHADLAAYLRGNSSPAIDAAIKKLQEDDPAYKLLFDLISEIRKQKSINFNRQSRRDTHTFEQLEALLENLVAGNANKKEKQLFVDLLLSSASFYRRLMIKLHQMSPVMAVEEIPEFSGEFVRLRSDEELLREAGIIKNSGKMLKTELIRSWGKGIKEIITTVFERPIPRFASLAVTVLAVLVVFGVSMTRVPYDAYWETPPLEQLSSLRGSGSVSSLRSDSDRLRRTLQALFTLVNDHLRKGDYGEAVEKFETPGVQEALLSLEKWLEMPSFEGGAVDSSRIIETQELVQDYYFYRGTSHLGNYRSQKKDLFDIANEQELVEAIQMLSKAEALARTYHIDTRGRESYYLGLTYAIEGKKDLARQELVKLSENSSYFAKARSLIKKL